MKRIFWSHRAICDLGWAQTVSKILEGAKLLYHSGGASNICSPWDVDTRQGYKWGWGGHMGYHVP